MYNIIYNEKILNFIIEYNITTNFMNEFKKNVENFPFMYPVFEHNGIRNSRIRIVKIPKKNMSMLYIVYPDENLIVVEDIIFSKSSVNLKL